MSNSYFPVLVEPNIPFKYFDEIETYVLSKVFSMELLEDNFVHLSSYDGYTDFPVLERSAIGDALAKSPHKETALFKQLTTLMETTDDEDIEVPVNVDQVLQEILKRAMFDIPHITITTVSYSDKMRPGSLSGSVTLITPRVIRFKSLKDSLEEMIKKQKTLQLYDL